MASFNIVTREEYQQYIKIRSKFQLVDASVQTDTEFWEEESIATTEEEKQESETSDSTTSDSDSDSDSDNDNDNETSDQEDDEDDEEEYDEDEDEQQYRGRSCKRKRNLPRIQVVANVKELFNKLKKRRYANPTDEDYYKKLPKEDQTSIKQLEDQIYNMDDNNVPLRFKLLNSKIDMKLKSLCVQKMDQLDNMHSHSDDYYKLYQWVESVAKLPIGKYKHLPITANDDTEIISKFLEETRDKLDTNVYGHKDTKEHIIRLLAKWISNKDANGLVIGLEGPAGCGKTSICFEICNALGLPSGFVSLGGMSSSEFLVGHSYTYEGSRWGKIAEILMTAQYTNPVIFFDELDKVSSTRHGEEIINTLIHLTDHTQNHDFRDKYFTEVPLDLSKCIIIFSYNNGELVNPILKDRMITIKAGGYNNTDKIEICKKHMVPKILKEYAFENNDIVLSDEILRYIINITEQEEGVRKLKRSLEELVSQLNVMRLLKQKVFLEDKTYVQFPIVIDEKIARHLISNKKDYNPNLHMMYM
jgi:ATP-dependent Lon protease